jgi:cytoskeletal protein CcmA (bactofilin family)
MHFKKRRSSNEIVSYLGEGAELNGDISFTNGLRVNGSIKGKIFSGAILEIGPSGNVEAEVTVKRILIKGEFHGIIHASDRVEIFKDGKVFGDIFTPCLLIESGALFDGRCNMSKANVDQSLKQIVSNCDSGKISHIPV